MKGLGGFGAAGRLFLCLSLGAVAVTACAKAPNGVVQLAPAWQADGEAVNSGFGVRAMGVGDVNGDGYGDLAVGAPSFENGRGKAYVYCGGPHGLGAEPCWSKAGAHVGDHFGDRVGQAGDVNGDGYADLFVAIPSWQQGPGRCEVYLGGPQGLATEPAWAVTPPGHLREQFGDCTHPTGDVNGDGYDDLLVGAYQAAESAGRALLYLGGPKGLAGAPAWVGRGEAEGDQYGYTLSGAGDLNGDGLGDVIIGAKFHDGSRESGLPAKARFMAGKAYAYYGSPQGLRPSAWSSLGSEAMAQWSVRGYGIGDVDGDGRTELLISEPGADEGHGRVKILGAPHFDALRVLSGRALGLNDFGRAAGPAGDLNGDGYMDVVAAGRRADAGSVYVWFGGPQGLPSEPGLRVQAADSKSGYGAWVAPAGDLDGDGKDDLVISAELESEPLALAGRVYVLYGRQCAGLKEARPHGPAAMNVYLPKHRTKKQDNSVKM